MEFFEKRRVIQSRNCSAFMEARSSLSMLDVVIGTVENLSRKFKFHYNLTRITGIWHEAQYTLLIITY